MLDAMEQAIRATQVDFREVGLREGMQSHGMVVPTRDKLKFYDALRDAGCRELNVVAFSNPRVMPQMADAETFLHAIADRRDGAILSGLVPNDRALDRAIAMRNEGLLDLIFLVFSESKSTLTANGMTDSPEALLAQIDRASSRAAEAGLEVSVFVSCSYGCSIEGQIVP